MIKQLSLTISKPCSEKWSNFTQTPNGGFCTSCSKVVIDFTKISDDEILIFFSKQSDHTCGRFRSDQLKSYRQITSPRLRPGYSLLKAGVLSLLMLLISKQGSAQIITTQAKTELVSNRPLQKQKNLNVNTIKEHHIKGVVIAEDGLPLPGTNIILKGSEIGTVTDTEGYFEFPKALNDGDVLVFSFIGYVPTEYKVPKQSPDVVEINLTLDFDIMGEVVFDQVYEEHPSGVHRLIERIKQWF